MKHPERTPLKELGLSQLKATPGNFRASVMLDSIPYQIGEDTPNRIIALGYCQEYNTSEMQPIQIFDDKGEEHVINGKLKEIQTS